LRALPLAREAPAVIGTAEELWMTHGLNRIARLVLASVVLVWATGLCTPEHAHAELPDRASFLDYGFSGFILGVEVGLPIGYISTGPKYTEPEWRKLVLGAGIGALAGLTTGFVAALADSGERGAAFYILSDAGYGALGGAGLGALVGVLIWVGRDAQSEHEVGKDMLMCASFGALIGTGLGIIFGAFEGASAESKRRNRAGERPRLARAHFTLTAVPASQGSGMTALVSGPLDF
jgi:hypothetical protein